MALNIPNQMATGLEPLQKGFTTGTNFYNLLVNQAMQRAQNKRAESQNERLQELQPLQKLLLGAKTQSALSNAAWNNMLMGNSSSTNPGLSEPSAQPNNYDSLKNVVTNKQIPSPSGNENANNGVQPNINNAIPNQQLPSGEQVLSQGNPTLHNMDRFAGIKGIPPVQTHYDANGNLITRYPSGKVTMQKVGPSTIENKTMEGVNKTNNKVIEDIQKQNPTMFKLDNTFKRYHQLVNEPEWTKMHDNLVSEYGGENGRKLRIEYLKNRGTEKEKDLIARIENKSSELVADMANGFKGPFKLFEKETIEKMKPQVWDTPVAQKAKLAELERAYDIQKHINKRIPELIRKEGLNSDEAFEKAVEETNSDEFIDSLAKKYGGTGEGELNQKTQINNNNNQAEINKNNKNTGEDFLKAISSQLIQDIPEATPKNIKDLADSEGKTVEQIADEFIQIRNKMWEKQGVKKRL